MYLPKGWQQAVPYAQGRGTAETAGIPANKKGEFVTKGSIAM